MFRAKLWHIVAQIYISKSVVHWGTNVTRRHEVNEVDEGVEEDKLNEKIVVVEVDKVDVGRSR